MSGKRKPKRVLRPRFSTPDESDEENAIRYNGARQPFQEELNLLMRYSDLIAHYHVVVRVTEEDALHRHIMRLRDRYSVLYAAFLDKWSPQPRPSRSPQPKATP